MILQAALDFCVYVDVCAYSGGKKTTMHDKAIKGPALVVLTFQEMGGWITK